MKRFVTIALILGCVFSSPAQKETVEIMKFNQLESLLQKNNDTLYIFNFWATWCKPCVEELPYFEDIHQKYLDRKVKVTLISLDFSDELNTRLIPFIQKKEIVSDVILLDESNPNDFIDKIHPEWSGAIPATLFRKGKESSFYERSFTYQELESIVNQKLSQL